MMSFVMPASMSIDQVPMPIDGSIKIRQIEAGRFAVIRYSGISNSQVEQQAHRLLQEWIGNRLPYDQR